MERFKGHCQGLVDHFEWVAHAGHVLQRTAVSIHQMQGLPDLDGDEAGVRCPIPASVRLPIPYSVPAHLLPRVQSQLRFRDRRCGLR